MSGALLRGEQALAGVVWGYEEALWKVCAETPWACGGQAEASARVDVGLYEFERSYTKDVDIEHLFVGWDRFDATEFAASLSAVSRQHRQVLLTVEPWVGRDDDSDPDALLSDVALGRYDDRIAAICAPLSTAGSPVLVRWGHEMEEVTGRYPWARSDAPAYVEAYRHFVDRCRSATANALFVWSPVGNPGLERYWPGQAYADYVAVSVYAFPEWELVHHGRVRSFDEIFLEKYDRVAVFGQPVLIAELGVTGEPSEQWNWAREAVESFGRYPLLKKVVYFNAVDSREAWPLEYSVPDWRIDFDAFAVSFPGLERLQQAVATMDSFVRSRSDAAGAVNFGAYDPDRAYDGPLAIEHFVVRWNQYEPLSFRAGLVRATADNRWPLVTVEPWPSSSRKSEAGQLLVDIADGAYDEAVRALCSDIETLGKPVFVRWAPHMDDDAGVYPWAKQDPVRYVGAYRHFVDRCRSAASQVFYVWSPAGNPGLDRYWPGRDYADYVGLSVYAGPEQSADHRLRTFDEIFYLPYVRVARFDRPIMVAELGVAADEAVDQEAWLRDAVRQSRTYPLLRTLVYFNAAGDRVTSGVPPGFDWHADLKAFPAR